MMRPDGEQGIAMLPVITDSVGWLKKRICWAPVTAQQ